MVLTYWCDPPVKLALDDFDAIRDVHLRTVRQVPDLIRDRPAHCVMISTRHSAWRVLRSGRRTNFFKVVWHGDALPHVCPTCGGTI